MLGSCCYSNLFVFLVWLNVKSFKLEPLMNCEDGELD